MDYSEYTFARLKEEYDIVQQSTRIFQTIPIVSKTPSARYSYTYERRLLGC